ncbi:MAG: tripartite tricarboxylate transporter substrate binding protein [Hyphomicrobiales bacterium]|nr:tripartite tricarboxylate transporter substrate binding protein [Hyphomicrobiales bacterium]
MFWRRREAPARWLVSLLILGASILAASAQEWPTKMIRAVVPLTAGSATDSVARQVLNELSSQLGQPIVVENRPGAGNTIGMAAVAQSPPDGYTLLINSSSHTIVPATYRTLPFDTMRDLRPVVPLGNMPAVIVVSPSKGYKTLADLVAAAKARPGAMNYASAGTGNFSHLATEVLRRRAGIDIVHVPSKGAPEAVTEVLAERADFFIAPLIVARALLMDGKLQALAVTGSQRALALPNVPTTAEAGYPGSEYNFWVGMFVPAKTPPGILDRLNRETARALQNTALRARFVKLGVDPMPLSVDAFEKLIRDEIALNIKIAAEVGLKAN